MDISGVDPERVFQLAKDLERAIFVLYIENERDCPNQIRTLGAAAEVDRQIRAYVNELR